MSEENFRERLRTIHSGWAESLTDEKVAELQERHAAACVKGGLDPDDPRTIGAVLISTDPLPEWLMEHARQRSIRENWKAICP